MSSAAAVFAAVVELVGGAALLLGAAIVVAAVLVVLNMLGVPAPAHRQRRVCHPQRPRTGRSDRHWSQ